LSGEFSLEHLLRRLCQAATAVLRRWCQALPSLDGLPRSWQSASMDPKRSPPPPETWSEEEVRRIGYRVVDVLARYLGDLASKPVFRPVPAETAQHFATEPLPAAATSADALLDQFVEHIAPYPFGNGHPRFYGWVNSPPEVLGVFAEALAAAMNPSCAGGNHAAIHLERQVVRWLAEMVGMPAGTMGLLVSGGSMAALTALAVARHVGAGCDVRKSGVRGARGALRIYKTSEGHGCYQKSVELLGLGSSALHLVEADAELRMVPASLEAAIREDIARGDVPIAAVATAGTVNTGAIDPLDAIADVCERYGVWFHVDGAYGAPAILSDAYRERLRGMASANSVAIDAHKWLYVPVECGVVLVKDSEAMRDAFSLVPPYLRTEVRQDGVSAGPWLSEYGFQQTRGFRALKLWMALRGRGMSGYKAAVERDIELARDLAQSLHSSGDFEVWTPQCLSIVAFRYAPPALRDSARAVDDLNRRVCEAVQLGGRAFLSSTILGDRFFLRACIVNPLARPPDIEELIGAVQEAGRALLGSS
jgi:aromatic-L-amino-acid decarboxylase